MGKTKLFSVEERDDYISNALNKVFDLIVIGGGITGAGIALDASSRGLSCLLLEKGDFASGTSSKSTKLIHGGLRYLKQLEIGLVRESGIERAVVHSLAPHLVHPEKMLLPIVEGGSFSKWAASLAISVYDLLAKVDSKERKRSLSQLETLEKEPLLQKSILKGGIEYSEYRTDDARLTIENIKTAHRYGAIILNYCKVEDLVYQDEVVSGVKVFDTVLDDYFEFKAKHIVSAAGPWVDVLREKDKSLKGNKLRLTKGVHLVFDKDKLPINQAVYFDAFDGRMLFAIPRGLVTYVGTSDTDYEGNKDKVECTDADTSYILNAINSFFNIEKLRKHDVISTWAGLRPLIQEEGKSPSELSRKDEIFISDTGFISIAGGKLTGYRKMAQRIVDLLQKRDSDLPRHNCHTDKIPLTENSLKSYSNVLTYIAEIKTKLEKIGGDSSYGNYLVSNYGMATSDILSNVNLQDGISFEKALIRAEIDYCYKYESIFNPADFFNRRTGMLYFNPKRLAVNIEFIMSCFKEKFNWDLNQYKHQYDIAMDKIKLSIIDFKSHV